MAQDDKPATYLLTWNPKRSPWDDFDDCIEEIRKEGSCLRGRSCGNRRHLAVGSRVFLIRQGVEPRGIVGSGHVERAVYEDEHWDAEHRAAGKPALYVDVEFDSLSRTPLISRDELDDVRFADTAWSTQSSGLVIKPQIALALEQLWSERNGLPLTGPRQSGPEWDVKPGESIKRTELHAQYGGRRQGGISPSRQSPNVMIFTDPKTGAKYGYKDGWKGDVFHYTGEGQEGDQSLDQGNAAILHHQEEGRALRLFEGSSGVVKYAGELELDTTEPYYYDDATELRSDRIRQVLVFRLRRAGSARTESRTPPKRDRASVPLEAQHTERALVAPTREPYVAERQENTLVEEYGEYIAAAGERLIRHRLHIEGEATDIINDAFNEDRNQLIEAKGTVTREAIRMAIGQLADYGRFYPEADKAVLLPQRPRPDLEELLRSQGITVVWRAGSGGCADNAGGRFLA
jgi:hypothetical protein